MPKKLNHLEKKMKFHCFHCSTTWQLLVIRTDSLSNSQAKCLNNCSQKWESLLIAYCQERQIIHFVSQEKAKEEKNDKDLKDWINQLKKNDQK